MESTNNNQKGINDLKGAKIVISHHCKWKLRYKTVKPKWGKMTNPQGKMADPRGKITDPQGKMTHPRGKMTDPQGKMTHPRGKITDPQGKMTHPQGKVTNPQGKIFDRMKKP
ncbi:MAG: hypothetical protein GTO45_16610 [Candidatus Aminicenantes bacterium]|nr:hypothetical protein [Candidatus Aminicenantes bacterium]NIM80363.1 hypothetical protein [Candidatus Aminicenantes bacterium]NIN19750.1 hypothetical protein [Candidatus Aminicenantes bacterium]NIN43632.1 hypothetical protein [Candidatus Aminicenantes bacterium]NIN86377.1 hypothetical protein [Candidatus Aminicenantes bacterium]